MTPLVLSLLSKDRTDAVLTLSHIVGDHGAQWRDTQITRVSGYVTGMALLEVPEDQLGPLVTALEEVPGAKVVTSVAEGFDGDVPRMMQMNVLGPDRESLVRDLLKALSPQGLQVREMRTHHHAVEDEVYFGATIMLSVANEHDDIAERAVQAAESVGLSAEAELVFAGGDFTDVEEYTLA